MTTPLNVDIETMPRLKLNAAIGFGGGVTESLFIHPDGKHLLYPLGACIVIREIANPKSIGFLTGHSEKISCMAISRSGKYVASGQMTHAGFRADIAVYDFEKRKMIHRMVLHKVRVQALAFSSDETFLASVGGIDDKSMVIWDLSTGKPLCGGACDSELTCCVKFFNNDNNKLITGGNNNLKVWKLDLQDRKITPTNANLGNLRRDIRTIVIEALDRYAYCGTSNGDFLCIQLQEPVTFKMAGPKKNLTNGILSTVLTPTGDLLCGCGGGDMAILSKVDLSLQKSVRLDGGVTSVAALGSHYFAGTNHSNVYYINAKSYKEELWQTSHFDSVNDVVFPEKYSELFATCGDSDIRLWNARTHAELLRIQVGSIECNCIMFTRDGSVIMSGWADGKLRAFGPQSGKLIFAITDAHRTEPGNKVHSVAKHVGVTAVCVDHAGTHILTGGCDGQVRLWAINGPSYKLIASLSQHKAAINDIVINSIDTECISASDDGSCILWDLQRQIRKNIMYGQCYFKAVNFFNDESQVLTAGSDMKLTYWDATECTVIRELEGSKTGEINGLDISNDGTFFATGGADKLVKLWGYDEGTCMQLGLGHSCPITKVKIAPDMKTVVTTSEEGSIMIWSIKDLQVNTL